MSEETSAAQAGSEERSSRPAARRRRRVPGGRQHRHEVKVTPEEEAVLLRMALAQRVSVPRLLVESALAGGGETASMRRDVIEELFAVHRLLATIANNVNQIAKATNATLETQPETFAAMGAVSRTAERIDTVVDSLAV
jgi:hypothetical protein